jgi:serine/threonine protein kinase
MVGTELGGRYRVEQPLGRGGMGRVFAATDQQLGRRVAVKLLREELTDAVAQERFMREARSAAALSHPHACRLYEVGEHEGLTFLVMELLEGELLADCIARGVLSAPDAVAIILPLMSAVTALHELGLIHRDLKPANVFLTPQGVKLLDFGLARHTQVDAAFTAPALTMAGSVAGTLRYMAPEQVTGDPVDERTDVFALGVMLFEMLTGHVPFNAETNVDWLKAVLNDDPQALGRPELVALDPIVLRALQRRSADRFVSVSDMAAALEGAMTPEPSAGAEADADDSTRDRRETIVVLPFHGLQDDADVGFLKQGVPEAVTALLSADPRWRVVSNREAMRFDDTVDLTTIGRELRVDRLLTGTFLRAGTQVQVTAQLVSAVDGTVLWSHSARHAFDDVLSLQDDICRQLLDALPAPADTAADAVAPIVPSA